MNVRKLTGVALLAGFTLIVGLALSGLSATWEAATSVITPQAENGVGYVDSFGVLISNEVAARWPLGSKCTALNADTAVVQLMYIKAGSGGITRRTPLMWEPAAISTRSGPFTMKETSASLGGVPVNAVSIDSIRTAYYGWVLVYGPLDSVACEAPFAAGNPLFAGATASLLDSTTAGTTVYPPCAVVTGSNAADSSIVAIMFYGNGAVGR